jgi:hypothetical protein
VPEKLLPPLLPTKFPVINVFSINSIGASPDFYRLKPPEKMSASAHGHPEDFFVFLKKLKIQG